MPFIKDSKNWIIGILLFILTVLLVRRAFSILNKERRLDELKQAVIELEIEKTRLQEQIEYKKTDDYVEEYARDELNLIKPGEEVYVIVENTNNP